MSLVLIQAWKTCFVRIFVQSWTITFNGHWKYNNILLRLPVSGGVSEVIISASAIHPVQRRKSDKN